MSSEVPMNAWDYLGVFGTVLFAYGLVLGVVKLIEQPPHWSIILLCGLLFFVVGVAKGE